MPDLFMPYYAMEPLYNSEDPQSILIRKLRRQKRKRPIDMSLANTSKFNISHPVNNDRLVSERDASLWQGAGAQLRKANVGYKRQLSDKFSAEKCNSRKKLDVAVSYIESTEREKSTKSRLSFPSDLSQANKKKKIVNICDRSRVGFGPHVGVYLSRIANKTVSPPLSNKKIR